MEGQIGATAVNDFSYSFFPSIEIDKVTPRMHVTMTYSPSLTIYQRTSAANQSGQGCDDEFPVSAKSACSGNPAGRISKDR